MLGFSDCSGLLFCREYGHPFNSTNVQFLANRGNGLAYPIGCMYVCDVGVPWLNA